jgi:hypothetical protein
MVTAMRTFVLLILVSLLLGCSGQDKPLTSVLPPQVQHAWTLKDTSDMAEPQAPQVVRELGLKRALEANYEGNGRIRLLLFEMNSQTGAFELIQKWRQDQGLAAYKGTYFMVANGVGPDRTTVASFLQALQAEIK